MSTTSDARLTDAERVLEAVLNEAPKGWLRSPTIECTVITEMTSFLADLEGLVIHAAGSAQADCSAILAIADPACKTHGKTRVATARGEGILDESGVMTILDGSAAARRMNDITARSVVVLLDQAEYDEEMEQLFQTYLDHAVDAGIYPPENGLMTPPTGVQPFIFGLPLQTESMK